MNFGIVVHCMVRDMAVDLPFPGRRAVQIVIPLSGSHIDGIGEKASRRRKRLTVSRDNLEWASVDMHRMNELIVRADKAHFQDLTQGLWIASVAG